MYARSPIGRGIWFKPRSVRVRIPPGIPTFLKDVRLGFVQGCLALIPIILIGGLVYLGIQAPPYSIKHTKQKRGDLTSPIIIQNPQDWFDPRWRAGEEIFPWQTHPYGKLWHERDLMGRNT